MSALLTEAEIERELVARGVPRERAKAQAAAHVRHTAPVSLPMVRATVAFPLNITLPWTALISDDRKYAPALDRHGNARIILRESYRDAKAKARLIAHRVVGPDVLPAALPLALRVRVYLPDHRVGHDVSNFLKCLQDAMQGVVYANDSWLYDVHIARAGIDPDAPRAEIEITVIGR